MSKVILSQFDLRFSWLSISRKFSRTIAQS